LLISYLSTTECAGVNLVILFDKRVSYEKKFKNHWNASDFANIFPGRSKLLIAVKRLWNKTEKTWWHSM